MKKLSDFLSDLVISALPLVAATPLSLNTLSHIPRADLKDWEPAFYSFLPMCFFFVSLAMFLNRREIRQLRDEVANLSGN